MWAEKEGSSLVLLHGFREYNTLLPVIYHPHAANVPFSPRHTVVDDDCRKDVFEISMLIAENSEPGRSAMINEGILPVLVALSSDACAQNVITSCTILQSLARPKIYRRKLVEAGVEKAMKAITR